MKTDTKLTNKAVAQSLKIGDRVTTAYYSKDANVIRDITQIQYNVDTGSTVMVWATNGGVCKCCNRPLSKPITGIDGAWFIPEDANGALQRR